MSRAGHVIANHSYSHRWLTPAPAPRPMSPTSTAPPPGCAGRPGYRPWFRFPFLDEGARSAVATPRRGPRRRWPRRGLSSGYVTVDTYDWYLEDLARTAAQAGREIDRPALRRLYVDAILERRRISDRIAVEALGRSPAHIMLLHETDCRSVHRRRGRSAPRRRLGIVGRRGLSRPDRRERARVHASSARAGSPASPRPAAARAPGWFRHGRGGPSGPTVQRARFAPKSGAVRETIG